MRQNDRAIEIDDEMTRYLSRKRTSRNRRAILALLALSVMMPSRVTLAQQPGTPLASPSASFTKTAAEVNKAGYSLKPNGLATNEWPNFRIDFSIERADQTIFQNLALADVSAKVDGRDLPVREGDLAQKESAGVLVLLDGSGSMAGAGVDKLTAAKRSLKTVIDQLDANERVGLIAFDEEQRVIIAPTADKEKVKQEIDNFTIRKDKSRYTRLYEAVRFGLAQAKENHLKHLLIISDGWEDTPETRSMSPEQLRSFKTEREQKLIADSRENDVRVFTVAIGNERGEGLTYVDRVALDNISKGANGGSAAYIELTPESGTKVLADTYLTSRLQQTLNDMRQLWRYSYSLTLRIDPSAQVRGDEHKLWVGFTVGDNPRVQLPIEYTYALPPAGVPIVKELKIQPAIFIQSAPRTVTWQQLLFIYLVLLTTLIVLAGLPSVIKVLWRGYESIQLRKAIVTVRPGSPLLGLACPNEGTGAGRLYLIKEDDVVLVCPNRACRTPHHLSCWAFNEHRCMQRNCETVLVVPDTVLETYGLLGPEIGEEHSWMTS